MLDSHSSFVESPVFLVGSERSGTTLLRLMLDHHPKIAFKHESEFMVTQISEHGKYPEMGYYRDWLRYQRVFEFSGLTIDERLDFVALLNDFLNQERSRDNKEIVGTTIHYQFSKLRNIWPKAKYIYLYRDGRDVAASVVKMGWAGNPYVAAKWWLEAEKEWDEVRSGLSATNWIEVRFENLIANTNQQLQQICAFLGVHYSEKMMEYVNKSTYERPGPKVIQKWKSRMPVKDVQRIEEQLGDCLVHRGYELSGHPKIDVSPLMKNYLYLQSRAKVFVFRCRKYGMALTLQASLAKRVGFVKLYRHAVIRINHIEQAHLK
jgi:hypothetical protein